MERVVIIKGERWPYVITESGDIFRTRGNYGHGIHRKKKTFIAKRGGYPSVVLMNRYKHVSYMVYQLVARAFLDKPTGVSIEIGHKDGDPLNSHVSNLEYMTHQQNMRDAARMGRMRRGENHPNSKLTQKRVDMARAMYASGCYTHQYIAGGLGVSRSCVGKIMNRKMWI